MNNITPSAKVVEETLSTKGNFTSSVTLKTGLEFVGSGYKEVGKVGSGVYYSSNGIRICEFRIDICSLNGNHAPNVPHVHFAIRDPITKKYISNNHVYYKD